jgi:DNA-directed RNA polymerase subunit RPC12/RpoP
MGKRRQKKRDRELGVRLKTIRKGIRFCRLRIIFMFISLFSHQDFLKYRCNICGKVSSTPLSIIQSRERASCHYCGSTLRFRSIINALSLELFKESRILPDCPESKEIVGVGMSDSDIYAIPLSRKFRYTNTYYHKDPKINILSITPEMKNQADFIISSDVFEHIPYPIEKAFENLYDLLRNHGVCIFSVPYTTHDTTVEYFPDLFDYKIVQEKGRSKLVNKTKEGEIQVYDDLCFHDGAGSTLAMRIFSRSSLIKNIADAGFVKIKIHDENIPEYGIIWGDSPSVTISMSKVE